LLNLVSHGFGSAVRAIIRPPRRSYTTHRTPAPGGAESDLGPIRFVLPPPEDPKKQFYRTDSVLTTERGVKLVVSLWEPLYAPGASSRKVNVELPCVLYLHGNSSCRVASMEILPQVLSAGFACCTFDFAGCGLSDGDFVTLGVNEADDVSFVVKALRARGRENEGAAVGLPGRTTSAIGVYGRSMGAATAIIAAASDPDIAFVIGDSPFKSLRTLIDELIVATQRASCLVGMLVPNCLIKWFVGRVRSIIIEITSMDMFESADPLKHASFVTVPALFCGGSRDYFVPLSHANDIARAWRSSTPPQVVTLVDCDHNTPRPDSWKQRVQEFLVEFAKTVPKPKLPIPFTGISSEGGVEAAPPLIVSVSSPGVISVILPDDRLAPVNSVLRLNLSPSEGSVQPPEGGGMSANKPSRVPADPEEIFQSAYLPNSVTSDAVATPEKRPQSARLSASGRLVYTPTGAQNSYAASGRFSPNASARLGLSPSPRAANVPDSSFSDSGRSKKAEREDRAIAAFATQPEAAGGHLMGISLSASKKHLHADNEWGVIQVTLEELAGGSDAAEGHP
jgi:pimeloyl-ACP methyl ester carboxylesterase